MSYTPGATNAPAAPVLCVDLDHTLVAADTLVEALLHLLRRNPALILLLPWWLLRGRAHFKEQVAARAELDAARLPYNPEVLALLQEERRQGRTLVLATAADRRIAAEVAAHLGLFLAVHASDGKVNLKAAAKAKELVRFYGAGGYVYVGDRRADLPVWRHAAAAVLVGGTPRLAARVEEVVPDVRRLGTAPPSIATALLRLARPHQWVKNLLPLVPLVTAHRVGDAGAWMAAGQGIVAACLAPPPSMRPTT